jgi:hypothetical protein
MWCIFLPITRKISNNYYHYLENPVEYFTDIDDLLEIDSRIFSVHSTEFRVHSSLFKVKSG